MSRSVYNYNYLYAHANYQAQCCTLCVLIMYYLSSLWVIVMILIMNLPWCNYESDYDAIWIKPWCNYESSLDAIMIQISLCPCTLFQNEGTPLQAIHGHGVLCNFTVKKTRLSALWLLWIKTEINPIYCMLQVHCLKFASKKYLF